jgi:hypothetical protein
MHFYQKSAQIGENGKSGHPGGELSGASCVFIYWRAPRLATSLPPKKFWIFFLRNLKRSVSVGSLVKQHRRKKYRKIMI